MDRRGCCKVQEQFSPICIPDKYIHNSSQERVKQKQPPPQEHTTVKCMV